MGYMANRYEHTLLGGSGDMHLRYSAAHEQLDSSRVSHASTRTCTRMYSRKYIRILAHAHTGTREYSNMHALTLKRMHEIHVQWTR